MWVQAWEADEVSLDGVGTVRGEADASNWTVRKARAIRQKTPPQSYEESVPLKLSFYRHSIYLTYNCFFYNPPRLEIVFTN
jgi:hypothetical protein